MRLHQPNEARRARQSYWSALASNVEPSRRDGPGRIAARNADYDRSERQDDLETSGQ